MNVDAFDRYESAVRSYCREFPAVFTRSLGAKMWDEAGREYLDFLSGAGCLNYGHNHPAIRVAIMKYIEETGIIHALDLHTQAKRTFIEKFQEIVLKPRNLNYRMQFTGPTGANAVEAALKLARKVTGRHTVIAFTNAFHGMSLGALAASATSRKRAGAGTPLSLVSRMPFDGYMGPETNTAGLLEAYLDDPGSGVDMPAAIILETVQAEGGVLTARPSWLREIAEIAGRHKILLILDEIQTGCGRTGPFFSFERAGIVPDIVCLSKSIGGYGLPLALLLIKPDLDIWAPGEHNGTFRGNNLALVAASAALDLWEEGNLEDELKLKSALLQNRLRRLADMANADLRGLGFLKGLRWQDPDVAPAVSRNAFARGLIAETCGARGDVLKLLPPLTIAMSELNQGLDILEEAVRDTLESRSHVVVGSPLREFAARGEVAAAV
ncbi:MAG: diaminobutyrate-2-oxoglutarate transaminase [Alphaproteobacteria bacterium]|jgi:diaminobutyrate-2-oxoglutarate transaminase|nr:diaminobutyrate-2-oxoglutarate transaminase [Alphaproteobacteria bacterium]